MVTPQPVIDRRSFLLGGTALLPWSCRRPSGSPGSLASASAPASARPPSAEHPTTLARFVDPLPVPRVLAPEGTRPDARDPGASLPYYRVSMREAEVHVHRDLPPVRMWTYDGSVPGPTIEARRGRGVLVEWVNELPARHFLPVDPSLCGKGPPPPEVRAVVHLHGAKVRRESDGYPDDWYTPGRSALHHYPNQQDAATLWYHDHAMGISHLNQYAGLFGLYLLRDEEEDALDLPRGPHEVPLVICDRLFDAAGQLRYPTSGMPDAPWVPEVFGDAYLVNGTLAPYLDVEPRRYRLRVVNASNARTCYLSLSNGQGFHQIGADQGLLAAPVAASRITLAPAERADLIVDFRDAAGQKVLLRNQAVDIMELRVAPGARPPEAPLPARLRSIAPLPAAAAVRTRRLSLNQYQDPRTHMMLMLLNGARSRDPVTERPVLDSVEIWELVNATEDTHPIHLHLVRFQILDRRRFDVDAYLDSGQVSFAGPPVPPSPGEAGWKDTVRAEAGLVTRIVIRFEGYVGRYAWHCHVLEHEANEMMRPFEVVAPA
jgi:spore coat protein A, manganese oxidase